MATSGGSRGRLGKDANPKYLGVKISDGQIAKPGQILVTQKGSNFIAGKNVKTGRNYSLYAMKEGKVHYSEKKKPGFDGKQKVVKIAEIE